MRLSKPALRHSAAQYRKRCGCHRQGSRTPERTQTHQEISISAISDYLRRNMEAANLKTIKRPLFTITLELAPGRAIIDNLDEIPDELVVVSSAVDPDKKAIFARLKVIRDYNAQICQRMASGVWRRCRGRTTGTTGVGTSGTW